MDYDPSTKTIVLNREGTDVITVKTASKKDGIEIKITGNILKAVLYKNLLFVHTNNQISQWSLETGELQRSYPYVTHSTEGRFIIHNDQIFILYTNTVKSFNILTGAFVVAFNINNDRIYTMVMIDEYLYTSSLSTPENALCRWNLNGKLECNLKK